MSSSEAEIPRKNNVTYRFPKPTIEALIDHIGLADARIMLQFEKVYGKLIPLVRTVSKYEYDGLFTFLQFYEPSLRSFLFPDYILMPTLEEFSFILGIPVKSKMPYFSGDAPSVEAIAEALYLSCATVKRGLSTKNRGFQSEFLFTQAREAAQTQNWVTYSAIIALCIYGLVLFPEQENLIDMQAIRVFISKNPVPILLGDFYFSVHRKNDKRKGGLVNCCTPLLCHWLFKHLPKKGAFVETIDCEKWSKRMMGLNSDTIEWVDHQLLGVEVITSCGGYPNVPLIGRKGGINYNPILAIRQFGYATKYPPTDREVGESLFFIGEERERINEVVKAWNHIHRKGKAILGKRDCRSHPEYDLWIQKKVEELLLPFSKVIMIGPELPRTMPYEEYEKLQKMVRDLQIENSGMSTCLGKALADNKGWEKRALLAEKTLADKLVDFEERSNYFKKMTNALEDSKSILRTTKQALTRSQESFLTLQQAWDEVREKNNELKEQLKDRDEELYKADEARRNHRDNWIKVQEQLKDAEDRLKKCQEDFEDVSEELKTLKIQAGIKRCKRSNDEDEAMQRYVDSLTETLEKRDAFIKELIEKPHHQRTRVLFEGFKHSSQMLKDLDLSQ